MMTHKPNLGLFSGPSPEERGATTVKCTAFDHVSARSGSLSFGEGGGRGLIKENNYNLALDSCY